MPCHTIPFVDTPPPLTGDWNAVPWATTPAIDINHFHPRSSDHHPRVQAKLLHDGRTLHVLFQVDDRYVRAIQTEYQSATCTDSCVEMFLRPRPDAGYFAVEVNCGGAFLLLYSTESPKEPGKFDQWTKLDAAAGERVKIFHSLPRTVEPEIATPTTWQVQVALPMEAIEGTIGTLGDLSGQKWAANFYKCADHTSHPHWGAWSPIGEALNFHQPRYFGEVEFAARSSASASQSKS